MVEKKKRRKYTAEYKREAVSLVLNAGMTQAKVARDLDVPPSCLGTWVKQAEVDSGKGPAGALTTEEKAELRQLRKDVKRLRMEREILKKATAFFAKENG